MGIAGDTSFTRMIRDERKREERRLARIEKAIAKKANRKPKPKRPKKGGTPDWIVNGKVDYHAYLASYDWYAKRQKCLKRAGHQCESCKSRDNLHVHHLTYKNLGHEPLTDLKVLCDQCHAIAHEDKGVMDALTKELKEIVG